MKNLKAKLSVKFGLLALICCASQLSWAGGYYTCGSKVYQTIGRKCPDGSMPLFHAGRIQAAQAAQPIQPHHSASVPSGSPTSRISTRTDRQKEIDAIIAWNKAHPNGPPAPYRTVNSEPLTKTEMEIWDAKQRGQFGPCAPVVYYKNSACR